jgi:uncharacterized alpha-E superfamily protein
MQKDDARAFLVAGGRLEAADMVLRMLARGAPARARGGDGPRRRAATATRSRLLRAVGGFQAFMRAAAAPPNAGPVSRFMLFEREFPDSVASSIESCRAALERVEGDPQDRRPCCACAGMLADLDFGHGCRRERTRSRRCSGRFSRSSSGWTARSTTASSIQAPW